MTHYPENMSTADWSFATLISDGEYFMLPLFILLLIVIYVFIERIILIIRATMVGAAFMQRIKDYIHENEIESAENFCRKEATSSANVVLKGIGLIGRSMSDIYDVMQNSAAIELAKLKKFTQWIAFSAVTAPLIGLAGGVTGFLVKIADVGESINVASLCTPFVTFAVGLFIGIIAIAAHYFIKSKLNKTDITLKNVISGFINLLNEPAS